MYYIQDIIKYHYKLNEYENIQNLGYSDSIEANNFIFNNKLAFLFGIIFDNGIPSKIAWKRPFELLQRIENLNNIKELSEDQLTKIIKEPYCLHRFPKIIAINLKKLVTIIDEKFAGNPENIWESKNIQITKQNLLQIHGIGIKKANLTILMLHRDFHIIFKDILELELAIDVHLERVLNRSGYFHINKMNNNFNIIFQKYDFEDTKLIPAYVGTTLWNIGQIYCKTMQPNCQECPLNKSCKKLYNK